MSLGGILESLLGGQEPMDRQQPTSLTRSAGSQHNQPKAFKSPQYSFQFYLILICLLSGRRLLLCYGDREQTHLEPDFLVAGYQNNPRFRELIIK